MTHPQFQKVGHNEKIKEVGWHWIKDKIVDDKTGYIGIKRDQTAIFRCLNGFEVDYYKSPHSHWKFIKTPKGWKGLIGYSFPSFRFVEGKGYQCPEVMWWWPSEQRIVWTKLKRR